LEGLKGREERYRLGQFFTPQAIAEYMAAAALEVAPATVLDPGVGGGVLLRALAGGDRRLFGLDVDPDAVELASESLPNAEIVVGDFLAASAWPLSEQTFDVVIANPPYIRHHNLSADHKALAQHYAARLGRKVSSLSGSYVYFFLEALLRLNEGGRLVFITPTEFLDVRYGQAVKEALLDCCDIDEVLVLEMDELAFEGVLTTSAITVATRRAQPSRRYRLVEGKMNGGIKLGSEVTLAAEDAPPYLPWTPLTPTRAARILELTGDRTDKLGDYLRVRRGIATGDNSFFCLTEAEVAEWKIPRDYLVPVVLGSKDLPANGTLDRAYRDERLAAGARGWLLWCHAPKETLPPSLQLYIEHGEAMGLRGKFNCKNRKPWYGVEPVDPPDFFVTYMSRDRARFIRNGVGARCMTSLLNVWAKPGVDVDELQAELQDPQMARLLREFGRTYGGGLGKIEPGDVLRVPSRTLAAAGGQSSLAV
jgi:adenine-specific DNA-methyltransferase